MCDVRGGRSVGRSVSSASGSHRGRAPPLRVGGGINGVHFLSKILQNLKQHFGGDSDPDPDPDPRPLRWCFLLSQQKDKLDETAGAELLAACAVASPAPTQGGSRTRRGLGDPGSLHPGTWQPA